MRFPPPPPAACHKFPKPASQPLPPGTAQPCACMAKAKGNAMVAHASPAWGKETDNLFHVFAFLLGRR